MLRITGNMPPKGVLVPLQQLPAGYGRFLGDAVAQWAIVEHIMSSCAWLLVRVPSKVANIAVREPRASDRMDMIRELIEVRKVSVKADLTDLKTKVIDAEQHRNILAHSVWCILTGTEEVFIIRTAASWKPPGIGRRVSRRMVPEAIPWSLTDFRKPHRALADAINGLHDLQLELEQWRGPWPGRLP
jgi:hypothetical protein